MDFVDPKKTLSELNLTEGLLVADIGAGSGFYAIESAKKVGETGKVYAVDVQDELLDRLKSDAEKEQIKNIITFWADVEDKKGLPFDSVFFDRIIVSNILFQLDNKEMLARECFRVLKDTGVLLVIDWSKGYNGMGPDQTMIVPADTARKLFEDVGFVFDRVIEAGNYHYGFVCKK